MENKNINDEFAELFAMLNENSNEHSNIINNVAEKEIKEEIPKLNGVTICKNESKKMKNTILPFIKFLNINKKTLPLVIGSVAVISLTPLFINSHIKNISEQQVEIQLDNETKNEDNKELINIFPNNSYSSVKLEEQIIKIEDNKLDNSIELYSVGKHQYMSYIYDYIEKDEYQNFEKNCKLYGTPTGIMLGISMQESSLKHLECSPGGKYYNGCAVGIMQIENGYHTNTTAYNYEINENETLNCSEEDKCDININIKIACMLFQKAIEKYKGNIYLAVQAHNYGTDMMDKVILETAKEKGITEEAVMEDYSNNDWMKYVNDIHFNPNKYISNWKYDTYGDNKYLEKVLNYCPETEINYMYDNKNIVFDLCYGNIKNSQIRER